MSALWRATRRWWTALPPAEHAKRAGLFAAHVVNAGCAWHLFLRYVGGPTHVSGPSMLPTMSASGEVCLEYTLGPRLRGPGALQRGQLVTFASPLAPGRIVCKRLAGLPGDVLCVDPTGAKAPSTEHVVVPRDHVWLVGDNAGMSRDSRDYGPVHVGLIRGTLVARIWPLRDFKIFENTFTPID